MLFRSDRPSQNVNDWLFVGTMAEPEYGTGATSEAYKMIDKAAEVKATVKALKEQGKVDQLREYVQQNKGYIGADNTLTSLQQRIANMRRVQMQIANNQQMDPDEKRDRINKIKEAQMSMQQQIHEIHRRIVEANNS